MSLVYYKFKSVKEFDICTFDSNGITVFDLKRDIMIAKKLGKGLDFDLSIYNAQTNDEYDDDSVVIGRNTSVLVARKPPAKVGQGTAQKYLNQVMAIPKVSAKPIYSKPMMAQTFRPVLAENPAEKEGINQMFKQQAEHWQQTQDQMANVKPVYRVPSGLGRGSGIRPMMNMDMEHQRPPPPGYTCFRCGERGHYINVCPTLGDPEFDNKPKIKKATGIPTMFLKTIKNKDAVDRGLMVTGEGDLVVAMPNEEQWKKLTAINKSFKTVENRAVPQELKCFICSKLVRNAVQSRCCQAIFCNDDIELHLHDEETCPKCKAKLKAKDLEPNVTIRRQAKDFLGGGIIDIDSTPDQRSNKRMRERSPERTRR